MSARIQTVDFYIASRNQGVRASLDSLRRLIKSAIPEVKEEIIWGAPVFSESQNCPLVYLYGGSDHANLGFLRGVELDDPGGLLEGKGKSGRYIKIFSSDKIPAREIRLLLDQCRQLASN